MGRYFDYINPKVILSRKSNFGVATYDAVKKMKEDGIITGNEDGKIEFLESPDDIAGKVNKTDGAVVLRPGLGQNRTENRRTTF